jgi:cell division septation protein DedD
MAYVLGAVVVLVALAIVVLPLIRPARSRVADTEAPPSPAEQRAQVYRELLELELDHRVGKIADEDFLAQSDALMARAASLMGAEDAALQHLDEQAEREIAAQRAALRAAKPAKQDATP